MNEEAIELFHMNNAQMSVLYSGLYCAKHTITVLMGEDEARNTHSACTEARSDDDELNVISLSETHAADDENRREQREDLTTNSSNFPCFVSRRQTECCSSCDSGPATDGSQTRCTVDATNHFIYIIEMIDSAPHSLSVSKLCKILAREKLFHTTEDMEKFLDEMSGPVFNDGPVGTGDSWLPIVTHGIAIGLFTIRRAILKNTRFTTQKSNVTTLKDFQEKNLSYVSISDIGRAWYTTTKRGLALTPSNVHRILINVPNAAHIETADPFERCAPHLAVTKVFDITAPSTGQC